MFEEFKSAFNRYNNAHVQLIIINVMMFVLFGVIKVILEVSQFDSLWLAIHDQIAIPARFSDYITRPWTLLTYMFMHDLSGILHILFNMLVLYWFGRLFVEYLGSDKLVALYLLGGIAGGVLYLVLYNTIPFYISRPSIMVGASAAVLAVVVAVSTLLPNYTFFLMFLGPVRIKYIAGFYIFISFLGSVGPNAGGNVAHLGGALLGFVYMKQLQSGINWGGWVTMTIEWFKDLFKAKPRVKVSYRKESGSTSSTFSNMKGQPGKPSQDELDAILDKISAGGYESLTKEEKEKLFNASKK
jgi:membrane associated rhomboid family serine protease